MNSCLASIVLSIAASSASAGVAAEIAACSNEANTIEISRCAATVSAREEARVKDEYSRSLAVLRRVERFFSKEVPKPELVPPFRRVQAAWEKYKLTECQLAIALAMGGSVNQLDYHGCLASLNEERANKLQSLRVGYEKEGY